MVREQRWPTETVDRILEAFPDEQVYTCAAGISPSGPVHFGNFRDVMTSYAVVCELRRRGFEARLIFSWDDYDRLRKVPAGMPSSLNEYIGMPLTQVPDPVCDHASYAAHLEAEFEDAMTETGLGLEYQYQTQEYTSGRYADLIIRALQHRTEIADILLSFMSDKGKRERNIDEAEFRRTYWPLIVYSRFTGCDNTSVVDFDGTACITYRCNDTGHEETVDIGDTPIVKLPWKVDWAMRWCAERIVFEPGGHDHASPGGSYDTSSVIARQVFGVEPPVFTEYQFVNIQGHPGKMSGSSGNVITPAELLQIYTPEILTWLYLRKNADQSFDLAFDTEVFRQYDEFDRAVADYLDLGDDSEYAPSLRFVPGISHPMHAQPMPFRQAVGFGQIVQWDPAKVQTLTERMGHAYHPDSIAERVARGRTWIETYNQHEKIALRETINREYAASLCEESRQLVRELHEYLRNADGVPPLKELETKLYAIPKREDVSKRELKRRQRAFFKDVYNLLIGQDTGPRLPTFIWAIGRDRILPLLDI